MFKHKADGTKYKDFYYYGCKHRTMTRGHKCDYKKQIHEELLETAVAEVITKLVSNPKFAALMQQKISMKVDTSAIEQEIANYEKQLRQSYSIKSRLIEEIDTLDPMINTTSSARQTLMNAFTRCMIKSRIQSLC